MTWIAIAILGAGVLLWMAWLSWDLSSVGDATTRDLEDEK